MVQLSNLKNKIAVASYSEAMEQRNHFKNGRSLKSQTSKGNALINMQQ